MWLCPVLGLLAGAALLTPLGTSDVLFGVSHPHLPSFLLSFRALVLLSCGPHSLRYNLTALSQDGSVQSRFVTQGYLDGRPFLHYEHGKGRAEPWRTWAEAVLGAETWDTETEALMEMGKDLRMALADIMALQTLKREPVKLQVQ